MKATSAADGSGEELLELLFALDRTGQRVGGRLGRPVSMGLGHVGASEAARPDGDEARGPAGMAEATRRRV